MHNKGDLSFNSRLMCKTNCLTHENDSARGSNIQVKAKQVKLNFELKGTAQFVQTITEITV